MQKVLLQCLLTLLLLLPSQLNATEEFFKKLVEAAKERTNHHVIYNGQYYKIPYPNGDVPKQYGVCTDVVIRTYRQLGIDLQKLVHEDMRSHFSQYPKIWGLNRPDTNIDHRRVPNLQVFFKRHGEELAISQNPADYKPGDLVTWNISNTRSLPHIGILSDKYSSDGKRLLVIHNIGRGPVEEDILFSYKITGHYRFEK